MPQFSITWTAPEFEYHEKDVSWYWVTIIIAALMIAFAVWDKNFLFGFFVVVAEVLVIAWGNQKPRDVSFVLTESMIHIDERKSYSLKEFESWSADVLDDDWVEIMLNAKGKLRTPAKFIAPKSREEEIRTNLKTVLKEVEYQLTLMDAIEKWLRF